MLIGKTVFCISKALCILLISFSIPICFCIHMNMNATGLDSVHFIMSTAKTEAAWHRDSNLLCLLAFRLFQMAQAWIRQAPAGALLYELLQLPGAFLCFLQTYLLNQVLTAAWKIRSVCKIFLLLNVYLDISVFLIWSGIFIQNICSCSNYSLL